MRKINIYIRPEDMDVWQAARNKYQGRLSALLSVLLRRHMGILSRYQRQLDRWKELEALSDSQRTKDQEQELHKLNAEIARFHLNENVEIPIEMEVRMRGKDFWGTPVNG